MMSFFLFLAKTQINAKFIQTPKDCCPQSVDCCLFFWAFRLSPSGFPLYLCSLLFSPRSKKAEVHSPKPEVRNRFAKDAAPIPNALAATSNMPRAVNKVTEPVEVTNLCLRQAQAPFIAQCSLPTAHSKKSSKFKVQSSKFLIHLHSFATFVAVTAAS